VLILYGRKEEEENERERVEREEKRDKEKQEAEKEENNSKEKRRKERTSFVGVHDVFIKYITWHNLRLALVYSPDSGFCIFDITEECRIEHTFNI